MKNFYKKNKESNVNFSNKNFCRLSAVNSTEIGIILLQNPPIGLLSFLIFRIFQRRYSLTVSLKRRLRHHQSPM